MPYGWDGIWADNTEPHAYPDPVNVRAATTALGKGALYINAYPLQHAKALYERWRAVGPNQKRVYVLTRSAFAGQQRYASTCWSGDINSDFPTFTRQVPAGLNFSLAGMPYWTTDIGGYWGHTVDWTTSANNELFTRWFQYGAFCPIFRIHGGGTRELYSSSWNATTKATSSNRQPPLPAHALHLLARLQSDERGIHHDAALGFRLSERLDGLRYQRPIPLRPSFSREPGDHGGSDEPFRVSARGELVRLLDGLDDERWEQKHGERAAESDTSVRKGRIDRSDGPEHRYATQSIDPLEIRVYKGRDGSFALYEDEGDTYNYENGQRSLIPFTWNETAQEPTIGARGREATPGCR
jgi:alpha-D-xyloside xylohydrolase